jgi:3-dehydroquinate synthase
LTRELVLIIPAEDSRCRVLIGRGLRRELGRLLAGEGFPPPVFVIADGRVAGLYEEAVAQSLSAAGFAPTFLTIPPGERSKSWPQVRRLTRELLERGAHRKSLLVALGGGVTGDVAGLVASLYMRGLPLVQVPTSLLAMVDAAIGGKTAINLPEGKNLLGTFHHPRLVLIDPEFLRTLPPREFLNGWAEVLKAGFIRNAALVRELAGSGREIWGDEEKLTSIIAQAVRIKADIVARDAREAGLRRLLNFGHTLGHALEAASRFRLPHGRGVALGMLAALRLSESLTGLPPEDSQMGRNLIQSFGYTRNLPRLNREEVLAALSRDKKRHDTGVAMVLLKHLGEAVVVEEAPVARVAALLDEILAPPARP